MFATPPRNKDVTSVSTQQGRHVSATLRAIAWFARHDHKASLLYNGVVITRVSGLRATWVRMIRRVLNTKLSYETSAGELFSPAELRRQRRTADKVALFSIVVPLYNTPEEFLRSMIESVRDQTYPYWELCMADGSDESHAEVERICDEYARTDKRIRYMRLEHNGGISANTNACLRMAAGDWIALLDHDDMLHPAALFEVARAIRSEHPDFVYTDECLFEHAPGDIRTPHHKPAFAPFNLVANNYICHFSTFRRALLDKVGEFCPECDGSQDHDMVLRLTQEAARVAHIPEVLYFWRSHPNSVAHGTSVKPYTIQAGVHAVERHLERMGLRGEVSAIIPGEPMYRVRYPIGGTPKVSVIMAVWGSRRAFWQSLYSVLRVTTYTNFEVVVVDCGAESHGMREGLHHLREHDVRVVHVEERVPFAQAIRLGAAYCTGKYLLTLAPDLRVMAPGWMQELLMFAQMSRVGAVGAKVTDTHGLVRQAGLCLGIADPATSYFRGVRAADTVGYMGRLSYAQNVSAVSAECMMIRRALWDEVDGFDPAFDSKLGDADLCMRLRARSLDIVWTPFAELRGLTEPVPGLHGYWATELETPARTRHAVERDNRLFFHRWKRVLMQGDPYYSPNCIPDRQDFSVLPMRWKHRARVYDAGGPDAC